MQGFCDTLLFGLDGAVKSLLDEVEDAVGPGYTVDSGRVQKDIAHELQVGLLPADANSLSNHWLHARSCSLQLCLHTAIQCC